MIVEDLYFDVFFPERILIFEDFYFDSDFFFCYGLLRDLGVSRSWMSLLCSSVLHSITKSEAFGSLG